MSKKGRGKRPGLAVVHPDAAGLDVGSRFHVAAVPAERAAPSVQRFNTFTGDLHRLADWLAACQITTVAMESTGIYWIPVYEVLEDRGFEVILANAREAKNVPGRKSDINDAQWLQRLHSYGLLRASFRPAGSIASLRAYLRHRERLLQYAAAHIQHIQKALMQMNLQLHHVVADVLSATGRRILEAILGGQRDPQVLAQLRDSRCKSDAATIAAALHGHYRDEHLLALEHALALYDTYQGHVADCDQRVEALLADLAAHSTPALPRSGKRDGNKNRLNFDARQALYGLVGVDLTAIDGLGPHAALRLVAECGTDMSRWPSAKHFTSWLGLAPGSNISGGKVLSARTRRTNNRAGALLRIVAVNIGRTQTALGAFYRRLSGRAGKAKAITATARKIAVLFYNTLRYGWDYIDPGVAYYEAQYQERVLSSLERRAKQFGYRLEPTA